MDKKIRKFGETEIKEYEFHQYKSPISINEILNILLVTKIIKKLVLNAYTF